MYIYACREPFRLKFVFLVNQLIEIDLLSRPVSTQTWFDHLRMDRPNIGSPKAPDQTGTTPLSTRAERVAGRRSFPKTKYGFNSLEVQ